MQINLPNIKFASGADIGWLPQMEAAGFVFRDRDGNERDLLDILKTYGINSIRLRTWVNPSDHPRSGHCSAEETLVIAKRAQAAGFAVMLNFHYSDSWADPKKQVKPAAWADLDFEGLKKALYEYTYETVKLFADNGVGLNWVQIGNETNPGMCLPDGSTDDFGKLSALYSAGHDAVKVISPQTKTMVHLAEGQNTDFQIKYFENLERHNCRYDMIGLSYYPYWIGSHYKETIDSLDETFKVLRQRFNKPLMLVETGGIDEQQDETYEMLVAVIDRVKRNGVEGFFYWEPQGARSFSKYSLSAWNADGTPTKAMDAYKLIGF
jgi:arabinogalactan endo-1,4-beta-galactosidase